MHTVPCSVANQSETALVVTAMLWWAFVCGIVVAAGSAFVLAGLECYGLAMFALVDAGALLWLLQPTIEDGQS